MKYVVCVALGLVMAFVSVKLAFHWSWQLPSEEKDAAFLAKSVAALVMLAVLIFVPCRMIYKDFVSKRKNK